jgi:hypothetical protein
MFCRTLSFGTSKSTLIVFIGPSFCWYGVGVDLSPIRGGEDGGGSLRIDFNDQSVFDSSCVM